MSLRRPLHSYLQKNWSLVLFALALLLYLAGNGRTSISVFDEAKNTECAREMLELKEWVVPTYNYQLRTDKPPLHYWFMMVAFKIFGVGTFAARFFSALAGALTVLISYRYLRRWEGPQIAFWTALVLLASLHFTFEFHLAVPDPYLILFFSLALWAFLDHYQGGKTLSLYLMYASLALACLAKGPVAPALAGLIFLLFLFLRGDLKWGILKRLHLLRGGLLFLLIASPWYILVGIKTQGEWLREFFLSHNLNRFSGPMEGHGGGFYLPLLFVIAGLLPFSLFLLQSVRKAIREYRKPVLFFSLLTAGTILLFFSASGTKLPNYPMIAYPFVAFLLGNYISQSAPVLSDRISLLLISLISLLFLPALYFGLQEYEPLSSLASSVFWMLPLPLGSLIGLFLSRRHWQTGVLVNGLAWIIGALVFFGHLYPATGSGNPPVAAKEVVDYESEFVGFKRFNPAFSMYLRKPVPVFYEPAALEKHLAEHPGTLVLTQTRFLDELNTEGRMEELFRMQDLFEGPSSVIVKIHYNNE